MNENMLVNCKTVLQKFDFDNWFISDEEGAHLDIVVSKKYLEWKGYKVGKKLKNQKYSDLTEHYITKLSN